MRATFGTKFIDGNDMQERVAVSDVQQVYKLWNEFSSAATEGDLERWIALWAEDGVQVPQGAPRRVGKTEIRKGMQPLFEAFDIQKMTIQAEEVRILGERAYSHGTFKFEMMPKEGGKTTGHHGEFLDVLVKQVDGCWKIAVDYGNFSVPQQQAGSMGYLPGGSKSPHPWCSSNAGCADAGNTNLGT